MIYEHYRVDYRFLVSEQEEKIMWEMIYLYLVSSVIERIKNDSELCHLIKE